MVQLRLCICSQLGIKPRKMLVKRKMAWAGGGHRKDFSEGGKTLARYMLTMSLNIHGFFEVGHEKMALSVFRVGLGVTALRP